MYYMGGGVIHKRRFWVGIKIEAMWRRTLCG